MSTGKAGYVWREDAGSAGMEAAIEVVISRDEGIPASNVDGCQMEEGGTQHLTS